MNHLALVLILLGAAGVLSWGSWRLGREFPTARRLDEVYGEGHECGYGDGWDARGLADGRAADHLTALLSTGTGAADDEIPAPVPAPTMIYREPPEDLAEDDDATAEWLHTMATELAAEEERPATDTEQFRAIVSRADGLERQCLLTLDSKRRYDKGRPAFLREAGISEERIRQLLGAE